MSKDIRQAFAADHFDVVLEHTVNGRTGYCAEHQTAKNMVTGKKKRAYYVEGSPYEMGYLMGYMAPIEIEMMCVTYIKKIIFEFLKTSDKNEFFLFKWIKWLVKKFVQRYISKWLYLNADEIFKDIPYQYKQEIYGLFQGYTDFCKHNHRKPKVTFNDLWVLNVGVDALFAFVYAPGAFLEFFPKLKPIQKGFGFRIPFACNGFSVFGAATRDPGPGGAGEVHYHYFGRDFMFPTADVFQDVACKIIYNPIPAEGQYPLVSMTAPGLVGSTMAMNKEGIAMGVHMAPAGNCDHHRDGLNSLMLVRHTMNYSASAQQAVDNIVRAQRGVSWSYIIADGKNDHAVAVEAGKRVSDLDFLSYPPDELKNRGLLPDENFLKTHDNQTHQEGLMVRWHNYQYPEAFSRFNRLLFQYCDKKYDESMFGERGYINRRNNKGELEHNCPSAYYFPPQRENKDDVLLMTNHFISPSIRLCGMTPWVRVIAGDQFDDLQWRYDKLNDLLLENYGNISWDQAWKIINFLSPDPGGYDLNYWKDFPDFKYKDAQGQTHKTKQVNGAISLCNLTTKVVQSRYGYFADEPVVITLLNYVD